MSRFSFKAPVRAIVEEGGTPRWVGWYADAGMDVVSHEEAPVVVKAGAMGTEIQYRAHRGQLFQPLEANWPSRDVHTTRTLAVNPVDMSRPTAEVAHGGVGAHFLSFPFRFVQHDVLSPGGSGFISLDQAAVDRHEICAIAQKDVLRSIEACIAIDGGIWRPSIGPMLTFFANQSWPEGVITACSTALSRLPRLDDVDAQRRFSAFDVVEVVEEYRKAYPGIEDKSEFVRVLSDEGWDRDASRLWLRTRALAATGLSICWELGYRGRQEFDGEQVEAYARLRDVLAEILHPDIGNQIVDAGNVAIKPAVVNADLPNDQGAMADEDLLAAVDGAFRAIRMKVPKRKAISWGTTLAACEAIYPRYAALEGMAI